MLGTLYQLGLQPLRSSPRVSIDNPYRSHSLRLASIGLNIQQTNLSIILPLENGGRRFVLWYYHEHRNNVLKLLIPQQRHNSIDTHILAAHKKVYEGKPVARIPHAGQGPLRNWNLSEQVLQNPQKQQSDLLAEEAAASG